jgi:hypothetical protein
MSTFSPLYIATDGYLHNCNDSLMPAVNGYWFICDDEGKLEFKTPFKKQGGGTVPVRAVNYIDPTQVQRELNERILKEEEEILIFIKAFVKCQ